MATAFTHAPNQSFQKIRSTIQNWYSGLTKKLPQQLEDVSAKPLKRKRNEKDDATSNNIFHKAAKLLKTFSFKESEETKLKKILLENMNTSNMLVKMDFPTDLVQASVRKLFDGKEFIGTFVYLSELGVGACSFHAVIQGKILRENSLTVDGCQLQHLLSYPFYDLSFYHVVEKTKLPHLSLALYDAIYPGKSVMMTSYPDYNSNTTKEHTDLDLAYGYVSGTLLKGSPLITAHYTCFLGSSGGAVLSMSGRVVGIHMESVYHETQYKGFMLQMESKSRRIHEDEMIVYPSLFWKHGSRANLEVQRVNHASLDILAKYAVNNIANKACAAAFLPSYHIRHKLAEANKVLYGILTGNSDSEDASDFEH